VLLDIQDDICCGFRAVGAAGESHHLAFDGPSTGTMRVANRDTIVERHKERVGIPVKRRMRSAMFVAHMMR
jgi:hypothetical protein